VKKRAATVPADELVLMDHIRELRTRIIICAAVLLVGGVVGYIFYTPILEWLRSPLGTNLYYSTPDGSFNFIIKVVSMVGILAAVPLMIYQLIMFIQPVFKERLPAKTVIGYTIFSILLAVSGALFAFYGILPGALKFFSGFQVPGLSALIDANNYLNFVINAIVTFILVFQIPLLMVIIDKIKPIPPKKLLKMEKWVVLGGLLVALIVPFAMDVTTCILIASPIIILYNVSVGIIIIRHAVAKKQYLELPAVRLLTPEEMALDDMLVDEFFATKSQKVLALKPVSIDESIDYSYLSLEPVATPIKLEDFVQEPIDDEVLALDPELESAPMQTVMRRNMSLPHDAKPKPGEVNVEALRAQVKAQREQQIAQRVAMYNNAASLRIINDIR
jgi:sec-independent protein translocase protein TatC